MFHQQPQSHSCKDAEGTTSRPHNNMQVWCLGLFPGPPVLGAVSCTRGFAQILLSGLMCCYWCQAPRSKGELPSIAWMEYTWLQGLFPVVLQLQNAEGPALCPVKCPTSGPRGFCGDWAACCPLMWKRIWRAAVLP